MVVRVVISTWPAIANGIKDNYKIKKYYLLGLEGKWKWITFEQGYPIVGLGLAELLSLSLLIYLLNYL